MKIGAFDVSKKVLIVAEIGNNHEGNFEAARKLVREAAACGVDAVKFQTFKTEYFVNRSDEARFNRLKSFELSFAQFEDLARLARSLGLLFLSTPLDLESAAFLKGIVDAFKIASGDINFYQLVEFAASTGKPMIVSTGASDLPQIRKTIARIGKKWTPAVMRKKLALLHCVTSYPASPEQINLGAIHALQAAFPGVTIGYSDHTIGIDAAVLSVAVGARIIEKHFTLDKNYSQFRDHQLSADPSDMRQLVEKARRAEQLLGAQTKSIQPCEKPLIPLVRRSAAAAGDLPQGHRMRIKDVIWLRPSGKVSPGEESRLVGRVLKRSVAFGEPLDAADVR